ncbi:hypothetical protein [Actinomycetospora sp. CA-053990]|uniref:hypothetical protein n=1 Tax=Actinomycetospora sp. CA-053990 TaxID=3239891 RepID=UPI003D9494FC
MELPPPGDEPVAEACGVPDGGVFDPAPSAGPGDDELPGPAPYDGPPSPEP